MAGSPLLPLGTGVVDGAEKTPESDDPQASRVVRPCSRNSRKGRATRVSAPLFLIVIPGV
jgi:hypothetical protein